MNLLTSIPFDKSLEIGNFYLENNIGSKVFAIVDSIASSDTIENLEKIPKFDNLDIYLNSSPKLHFSSYPKHFYLYKYNLMNILSRWVRTYTTRNDFANLDYLSNRVLLFWYNFIIENKVHKIVLGNIPHTPHDYSIYVVSKMLNIELIIFQKFINPMSNVNRYLLIKDLSWVNIIIYDKEMLTICLPNDLNDLLNLNNPDFKLLIKKQIYTEDKKTTLLEKYNMQSYSIRKITYKFINRFLLYWMIIQEKSKLKEIISLSTSTVPEGRMLFFPLHFQPEATTIPIANYYSDQLNIVRLITSNLPDDFKLCIKEHPAYWKRKPFKNVSLYTPIDNVRPVEFYRELSNNPKVVFLNPNLDSHELIRQSIGVVTVSGTVSLEAALLGKCVLLFGEHYYSRLYNVTQFKSVDDLDHFFKNIKDDSRDNYFSSFLNLVSRNSIIIEKDFVIDSIRASYLKGSEIAISLFNFLGKREK